MKNLFLFLLIAVCSIAGICFAQTVVTRIDSINVNFDSKTATIQMSQGYYDNSGTWESSGMSSPVTVVEPAFDLMLNTLATENALNLNAVESAIQNSI